MEEKNKYRNMTISTKVSAEQKAELVQLAKKLGITFSEFICTLIITYMYKYGKSNDPTERELILEEELRKVHLKIKRMEIDKESADYKVEMEIERAQKAVDEKDELRFQLKEMLTELTSTKEECGLSNVKIAQLENKVKSLESEQEDSGDAIGTFLF
jgi:hypothetical protein